MSRLSNQIDNSISDASTGVYYLLLEKEKMHVFNRFYLLFGLVFSMVIPFITIEVIEEIANLSVQNSKYPDHCRET